VSRRTVHLVSTERHVEHALAQGKVARTWRSFVAEWATNAGLDAADPEMTRLATAAALAGIEHDVNTGGSSAIVATLDAAMGVLCESGVDAATLRRTGRPRAELFARLLEGTSERLIAAGAFDRRSAGFFAAQALERAPLDLLPGAVEIEGLVDFTAAAHAWVQALARRIRVTVRMPRWAGASSSVARATDALLSLLEERWEHDSRGPDLELDDIQFPAKLELLETPSDGAEARGIAGAVRDALRGGIAPADIAIVLPSLDEEFLEPLRATLDEASIPFSEPRGRPPIATPLVRAALAWLEITSGPLVRDALVDLLRTSVVDPAPFIDGATARERRERALTLCRRLSRMPVSVDRDGTLLADLLAAETNDSEPWLSSSLAKILAARRDLQGDAPRRVLAARLVEVWHAMGLGPVPIGAVADLVALEEAPVAEPGDPRATEDGVRTRRLVRAQIREQGAGQAALLAAVERVQMAADALGLGDEPVSIERLRSEIEAALAGVAPVAMHRPAAVRIVRVADVAFLPLAFLVIARASEGAFESAPTVHPVLGDELLKALPQRHRPPTASLALAAQRTTLLSAIAFAERVLVTRSVTDVEGRPAAPAALFSELSSERAIAVGPSSVLDPRAAPLSARAAELVALGQGGTTSDTDLARRVAIEQARLEFFLDPRLAAGAVTGAISTADPAMAAHLARAIGGTADRPMAATALERAAGCRFAAFALGVLGAQTTDATGEELEPWQRGSLVHRALLVAMEATRAHAHRDKTDVVALGTAAARRAMLHDRNSPLYRAEVERALRDVEAVLLWSFDDASGFRFAYGERSFGETKTIERRSGDAARTSRNAWPALRIGDGHDAVYVKGRIDRVDITRDGTRARVIDYKTGALPAWKDVGTLVFQPPLYALALWLEMGPLSLPEIRALYLDTSKRPPRVFPADKSQVFSAESMTSAQQRAKAIVLRMRAGDIAPRPADALVCGRCSVRDVCRRPAAMPIEDPELDVDGGAP